MNELFLAIAEERRLKAARDAQSCGRPRALRQPLSLSPTWGQRLAEVLGQVQKLRLHQH